jgi:pyruvate dehydrogenase E2 component (dihydrolipoyllysine-residue acetyltransferase)
MPTDVVMPQMGESIFEGTLTKWLKKPGEKVQRDEPLFEISTDKVDAEIPAPTSGTLGEIKVKEGTTVQVNTVVATIVAEGEAAGAPSKGAPAAQAAPPAPSPQAEGTSRAQQPQGTEAAAKPRKESVSQPPPPQQAVAQHKESVIEFPHGEGEEERVRSSPLVRRIAKEHGVDLAQVQGSGLGGRITKDDIQNFVAQHGGGAPAPSRAATAPAQHPAEVPQRAAAPAPVPERGPIAVPGELVPMTQMRKVIAQRMVESKRTSAHVHSVFEVDVTRIMRMREREKAKFEQTNGVKLTVMPFFARAVVNAIRQHPIVNSSVEGDSIRYHQNINLGIAVALDWGLIVPVLRNAEDLSFVGLQRAISDMAERARSKKLRPDEVQGGTFTITNPGVFGPLFGTPVIMQPQVAILGMGGIFKTPVVRTDEDGSDAIVIRHIIHLSLGYDHRIVDGADADKFLATLKKILEGWNESIY